MDIQLEKEIYTNGRGRSRGRTIIRCCSNCNEPGYNVHIYKKDKEMFNIYNSK